MVHLIYDFKKLEEELKWLNPDNSHLERNQKFNNLVRTLKFNKIKKMVVFDKDGRNIRHDKIGGFKEPYIEVNYKLFSISIRHLTYVTEEFKDELVRIADGVLTAEYSVICEEPCNKCGKHPRADFDGICMDCADEMGISELFISSNNYDDNLQKARMYLNTFQMKIGSSSFMIMDVGGDMKKLGLIKNNKITKKGKALAKENADKSITDQANKFIKDRKLLKGKKK